MTNSEYHILSKELQSLVKSIPLNWGRVQNKKRITKSICLNVQH